MLVPRGGVWRHSEGKERGLGLCQFNKHLLDANCVLGWSKSSSFPIRSYGKNPNEFFGQLSSRHQEINKTSSVPGNTCRWVGTSNHRGTCSPDFRHQYAKLSRIPAAHFHSETLFCYSCWAAQFTPMGYKTPQPISSSQMSTQQLGAGWGTHSQPKSQDAWKEKEKFRVSWCTQFCSPDVISANRQQALSQPSSEIQFLMAASLYQDFSYWGEGLFACVYKKKKKSIIYYGTQSRPMPVGSINLLKIFLG